MLTKIPLLSLLMFSVTYPLFFWLSFKDPLKKNFHHFHIGLPNILAGVSVGGLFLLEVPNIILVKSLVWLGLFLFLTFAYWKKETVNPVMVTVVSIIGMMVYVKTHSYLLGFDWPGILVSLIGGLILSGAFYAMNLGHWYLNVHGLPLSHLKKATIALGCLLGVRLIWDLVAAVTSRVLFKGELTTIGPFFCHLDGIFLIVAFFFGTLFPLISIYFVWGTLQAKSTQSATGILYVLLSALLIGDIAYKFYLLHYGLAL